MRSVAMNHVLQNRPKPPWSFMGGIRAGKIGSGVREVGVREVGVRGAGSLGGKVKRGIDATR